MPVQPYLFFNGRCQEAIDFYVGALGAEMLVRMHYRDAPGSDSTPSGVNGDMIMHASLRIGGTDVLMSDGMGGGEPTFEGFSLTLQETDDAVAKRAYEALSSGGAVITPLSETFFATSFAMLKDRFGVPWIVIVGKQPPT